MINPLQFAELVPSTMYGRSGSVFYSGTAAFSQPAAVYILGLNPGGSPIDQADETVGRDLMEWNNLPERWSAYQDESWRGRTPGTCGMQPRVLHMIAGLGFHPHAVPASNVVFVRSAREAALEAEKAELLKQCWPVHRAVIEKLAVSTIVCFGGTAGRWVRLLVGANQKIGQFVERNARRWTSEAHIGNNGLCVVTATHPSIADWRNPSTDPTPFVLQALNR